MLWFEEIVLGGGEVVTVMCVEPDTPYFRPQQPVIRPAVLGRLEHVEIPGAPWQSEHKSVALLPPTFGHFCHFS